MNTEAKYVVIALREKQGGAINPQQIDIVEILKSHRQKWKPVVGEPIPDGISTFPDMVYSNILVILDEGECALVEALDKLSLATRCRKELENVLRGLLAKCINGFVQSHDLEQRLIVDDLED